MNIASEVKNGVPASFVESVLDAASRDEGPVPMRDTVAPFPAALERKVSLVKGKVQVVWFTLPDFDDESKFEQVLAMMERALEAKLGKPKRSKRNLSSESSRSFAWLADGREILLRGAAYLEPSGQVTHRQIELTSRKAL